MATKPPFQQLKDWDFARLLGDPVSQEAFFTPQGGLDLGPQRVRQAQELSIQQAQSNLAGQFDQLGGGGLPDWADSPWLEVDPVKKTVNFKEGMRKALKAQGIDPTALQHRLSQKLGAYKDSGTFVEGLAKGEVPSDIAGGKNKLDEAKRKLFNEVARSLAGATSDEEKAAVFREAFGRAGPEASQQLLKEFGDYTQLTASEQVRHEAERLKDQPVGGGPLGQLLEALDAPSDVVQNVIGVLRHKRTGADVLDSVKQLVEAPFAVSTLGLNAELPKVLGALGADKAAELAQDTLLDKKGEVSFGDVVPEIHGKGPLGYALGFAGELATDPLTYLSLGAGSLGKQGARELVGTAVERLVTREGGEAAAKGAKVAVQEALGNRINFQQALRTFENLGYDPAALAEEFPRVGLGRAGAAATQARGGVTLRAGVPGTNLKFAANLATGGGKVDLLVRPRLISNLLDQAGTVGEMIRNPLHLADKLSRNGLTASFRRANPVFADAWDGVHREASGVEHRATNQAIGTFRQARTEMTRIAKRAHLSDEELQLAANDIIELGTASPHYDQLVARVGTADANRFAQHAAQISTALEDLRQAALAVGADVPELADQAAGKLGYLPHRLADTDLEAALAKARLPGRLGAAKHRELRAGGAIQNPISGQVIPVPQGTLNQINAATEQMYGRAILNADPFQVAEVYAYGIGKVIRNSHAVNRLVEEGYGSELADDLASHYRSVVTKPEEIKRIYTQPLEAARKGAADAYVAQEAGQRQVAAAARSLAAFEPRIANELGEVSRLRELGAVRSEVVGLLTKTAADKRGLFEANKRLLDHEREIFSTARDAELRDLTAAGALPHVLRATSAKWRAFERSALADYQQVSRMLAEAPESLRKRAEAHLGGLRPEAAAALRGASGRPYAAVLADALDTQTTITAVESLKRHGAKDAFNAIQDATQSAGFVRARNEAVALAQRMGQLQRRMTVEAKAGRFSRVQELQDEYLGLLPKFDDLSVRITDDPAYAEQAADVLRSMRDPELRDKLAGFEGGDLGAAELIARHEEAKLGTVDDVADLVAQQRGAVAAGNQRLAAHLAEQIAGSRELGQRMETARRFVDAQRAIKALAQRGLHPQDAANTALVRGLKEHLDATLAELDQAARGRLDIANPTRAVQALQARYLEELDAKASIFADDWRTAEDALQQELGRSQTVQEQLAVTQAQLRQLVKDQKLSAAEYQTALGALDNLTVANADALGKLLAQPEVIEHMVPHLSHLALVVEKVPYANRTLAMPEDIARAITASSTPKAHNRFVQALGMLTNHWKRGTLAVPGSTGRRMIGELINASYLGGMTPPELKRGITIAKAVRRARGQVDALPPELRELGEAMVGQNIFEGRLVDVYAEQGLQSEGLLGNKVKPIVRSQDFMFERTANMEDALRAALFVHARSLGMTDVGARAYVGKYLFFHDELSELEQGALRSVVPFWTYLRNNTQLQLEMLFAKPGRLSAYNSLVETASAPQEAEFGPDNVYQQGGFPLPIHGPAGQEVFYPGLFDQPQGLGFVGNSVASLLSLLKGGVGGTGEGLSFQELNPGLSTLSALLFNRNLYTGAEYGHKAEPYGPFGTDLVDLTPRNRSIIESLIPQLRQAGQLTAAGEARQEAPIENLISLLLGPTVRPISERSQAGSAASVAGALADLNLGNPTKVGDVTKQARDQRDLEYLQAILAQLGG